MNIADHAAATPDRPALIMASGEHASPTASCTPAAAGSPHLSTMPGYGEETRSR